MALPLELLEEIGLTKSEIKVYLALLELGSSTTGPIVDKSGASSSKIYEIMDKLLQKGLVSYIIKEGMKYFEAADPNRILDYLKEKQTALEEQTKEIKKLLPELELKRTLSKYKSTATIYKGMKGLETAFQDIFKTLKKGDTNYVYVVGELDERMNEFFKKQYTLRAKQGIKTKTIFSEVGRKMYESRKTLPLFEGKVVGTTTSPATINIYGTKVNLRMGDSQNVICIVIDNKELADSFLEQFNLLWNQDVTVTKGWDNLIQTLKGFVDDLPPKTTFDALGTAFGPKGLETKYAQEFAKFHKYRLEKGKQARWLFQQGSNETIEKNKQNYQKGEIKFLPYKTASPVSIHPGKDRSLLVIQEKEPIVININNKEVAESFHHHFESFWNQEVIVYKGFEDVTNRFWSMLDQLKPEEEYQVLGASHGEGGEKLLDWFLGYHSERVKRKIKVKLLSASSNYEAVRYQQTHTGDPEMKLSQIKTLPPEFSAPMQINLYPNNKVLMFMWSKEFMCFEIESEILHNNFKNYFDVLWNQEIKVQKGLDAVQNIFEEMLESGHIDFLGARGYFMDARPEYSKDWIKRAQKRGFTWRNIVNPEVKGHLITTLPFAETKYNIPKEFTTLTVFWIYNQKVSLVNWFEKEPIIITIENENFYNTYKRQFELLWNQKTATYQDEAGVKAVFDDMLDYKEVWFIKGNDGIKKYFPKYWEKHNRERIAKNVFWHDLIDAKLVSNLFENQQRHKVLYYEYKVLPPELSSPHVIAFYGNKVVNIIWGEKTILTVIEDEEIRKSYKNYFDYLWKSVA